MEKTPGYETSSSARGSQEPGAVKKEITYRSALRDEGIDEVFVARKLKDLLRAKGRRWNPKKGSWEKFEDYGTQLAALRRLPRFLPFTPPRKRTQKTKIEQLRLTLVQSHPLACLYYQSRTVSKISTGDGREHRER